MKQVKFIQNIFNNQFRYICLTSNEEASMGKADKGWGRAQGYMTSSWGKGFPSVLQDFPVSVTCMEIGFICLW